MWMLQGVVMVALQSVLEGEKGRSKVCAGRQAGRQAGVFVCVCVCPAAFGYGFFTAMIILGSLHCCAKGLQDDGKQGLQCTQTYIGCACRVKFAGVLYQGWHSLLQRQSCLAMHISCLCLKIRSL